MTTSREDIQALRRRAEDYLKKSYERMTWNRARQDPVQLVHELHVYQIELEMQCEEMRRAQQELEESRNKYAELYESIPVGYFTFDRQGTIEDVNPAGCALLNRQPRELEGKRFQLFMPTSDRRCFSDFCKRVLDAQDRQTCEVQLSPAAPGRTAAGEMEETTVLIEGRPVKTGEAPEKRLRAAVIDITDRKRAERRVERQEAELRTSRHQLQEMNAKILNVQDEERRIIARDLHDDCCQQLALLVITANSLERMVPEPVSRRIHAMGTQVKQVLDTVRHIAYGLHPAIWETTGIEEAARNYFQDFTSVTELPVQFTATGVPSCLPRTIATCLFRTLQETLHNIVKYAQASQITVRLEKVGDSIKLTVADNGRGLDISQATTPRGLGLISMRERVRLLNGTFEIGSRPGAGTTVQVSLPLIHYT
jgi:PAS domain S-box-containing protein